MTSSNTPSPDPGLLRGLSSVSSGDSKLYFTSRPKYSFKTGPTQPATKHCPQQAKRATADNWAERKRGQDSTAGHTQHTRETLPEVPGTGEQETLHGKALPDLVFIRPLLSRAKALPLLIS